MTPEFLLAALIVVLIPGTGVIYTIATGVARGFRASAAAAYGCTLGILPAITASFIGLAALLHAGAIAFTILKYAGAAYLLYLAWLTWNDRGPISLSRTVPTSAIKLATTGALINVLNPKLSIFFLAFLPQFIDTSRAVPPQLAVMSATFMAMTFAVFLIYGALASAAGNILRKPAARNWIRRGSASAFAILGTRLALSHDR